MHTRFLLFQFALPPGPDIVARGQSLPFFVRFFLQVELWVDLLSSTQLQDFSQIYVFQPETMWHKEVQSKLPPAVRYVAGKPFLRKTHHHRAPVSTAFAAPVAAAAAAAAPAHAAAAAAASANLSAAASAAALVHHQVSPRRVTESVVPAVPVPALSLASSHAILLRSGADASHEEKVTMVFDEMDAKKVRAVDINEFQTFLINLQFEFSVPIISDLFTKADSNRDATISYPEFQRFAERYPTLLDAMHYRAREYWQDVRQKEGIEAARRLLDSLRARESDARVASAQAATESSAQEGRLAAQTQAVADAEARERETLAVLDAARVETERARAEVAAKCAEEAAARDIERAKQLQHAEAQREVEASEARLRVQESEQAHAEERLKEIERLLMEQQREVEAQRCNTVRARADVATAQGVEGQAALISAEATKDVQCASERLSLAKADLARAQDRERDCTAAQLGAREATAHQRVQREREEQELLICREREAAKRAVEVESSKAVEAQEAMLRSLEQENMEHLAARAKVQTEETPLIDQEVRLRDQRDALEAREALLRDEAGAFTARTTGTRGVASPRAVNYAAHAAAANATATAHQAQAHFQAAAVNASAHAHHAHASAAAAAASAHTNAYLTATSPLKGSPLSVCL